MVHTSLSTYAPSSIHRRPVYEDVSVSHLLIVMNKNFVVAATDPGDGFLWVWSHCTLTLFGLFDQLEMPYFAQL